jgi:acetyltransferase-like isoleucine patch superfamily enzyme
MIKKLRKLVKSFLEARIRRSMSRKAKVGPGVKFSSNFLYRCTQNDPEAMSIGSHTHMEGLWVVQGKGKITIGRYCSFRRGTYVGAVDEVIIGDHVYGAENVFIIDNNNHPVDPEARLAMTLEPPNTAAWKWNRDDVDHKKVSIGNNVWLGRNCMILKGVVIGEGSVIAAGAVVTKSVPAYSVAAGNPARVVKTLNVGGRKK